MNCACRHRRLRISGDSANGQCFKLAHFKKHRSRVTYDAGLRAPAVDRCLRAAATFYSSILKALISQAERQQVEPRRGVRIAPVRILKYAGVICSVRFASSKWFFLRVEDFLLWSERFFS